MENKTPQDYYFFAFSVEDEIGVPSVVLTSKEYFDKTGFGDDNLGSHSLNEEVKSALKRAGVYAEGELMEAVFEVIVKSTSEAQIIKRMEEQGFVYNENMKMS